MSFEGMEKLHKSCAELRSALEKKYGPAEGFKRYLDLLIQVHEKVEAEEQLPERTKQ